MARPRRCLTLSNPVPWQNWMMAYLGYILRMKSLFHGWPVMVMTPIREEEVPAVLKNPLQMLKEIKHLLKTSLFVWLFIVTVHILRDISDVCVCGNIYVCRYCINYAPFDFVYKLCKFMPIRIVISILKEVQRANKVHHGVLFALKNFPGSHIVVGLFGILKGSSSAAVSHWLSVLIQRCSLNALDCLTDQQCPLATCQISFLSHMMLM